MVIFVAGCCNTPALVDADANTVTVVAEVVAARPMPEGTVLTLMQDGTDTTLQAAVTEETVLLSAQGTTLQVNSLTPGATVWLQASSLGSSSWAAREIRVLPR
jgi:hypothetical protein